MVLPGVAIGTNMLPKVDKIVVPEIFMLRQLKNVVMGVWILI